MTGVCVRTEKFVIIFKYEKKSLQLSPIQEISNPTSSNEMSDINMSIKPVNKGNGESKTGQYNNGAVEWRTSDPDIIYKLI